MNEKLKLLGTMRSKLPMDGRPVQVEITIRHHNGNTETVGFPITEVGPLGVFIESYFRVVEYGEKFDE